MALAANAKRFAARFVQAELSLRASALAFDTLLSLVPILGVFFWYLSSLEIADHWLQLTKTFILQQLNVDSGSSFERHFNRLTRAVHNRSWGWVGLGFLGYTVWNLIGKFGRALDLILESHQAYPDSTFSRLVLVGRRLLVMLGLPVALTLSLGLSQWIRKDSWFHTLFDLQTVGPVFAMPLAWVGSIVAIFLVYFLVPRSRVGWREALRAALIAGPALEFVRFLFGVYNNYAFSVHSVYGVFAVIPMFILWVQVAWLILLSGALLVGFRR